MLITNFSSGEISPTLDGRTDLQQYYQAAEYICNFNIIPTGGIKRRPGFKRLGQLNGESRLIPFIINKEINFVLECTSSYFYVWKNGQKYTYSGEQVKIPVPYTTFAAVKDVQYCQYYDSLILTHPDYKPVMITYSMSGENFTVTENGMSFNFLPEVQLDDAYDYIVIMTGSAMDEPTHDDIPIYPAVGGKPYPDGLFAVFQGKLYKWDTTSYVWQDYDTDPQYDDGLFTDVNKRPTCCTFFNGRLYFASSKQDRQTVWASMAPDTNGNRYFDFSTYKKYVTVNKVVKDADMHVFSGNLEPGVRQITNLSQNFLTSGLLQEDITNYYITSKNFPIGTKVVSVTTDTMTLSQSSINSESLTGAAFSISLWKSTESPSADDYHYQVLSRNITTADCAFNFDFASEENDAVKWLSCNKYLVAGTESAVWCVPSGVNALSIAAEMSGKYGSDDIQALCVDTATVFFAQGKKGIREFYYNSDQQAFRTNNIAIMAEELLAESPAVDFDYATNPYNRLIITRADGKAIQLLYDRSNGIAAWSRITHGEGIIKSCCVTGGDDEDDLLYFVVKDGLNYYLERLDDNDTVYLDSWEEYDPQVTYSGDDLVLWNATTKQTASISSIPVNFIHENDVVYIGYTYQSNILSLPVINSTEMNQKRIVSLTVRFYKSAMPVMDVEGMSQEYFSQVTDDDYSGVQKVNYPGNSDRDVRFGISTDRPQAVNILSVNAQVR